MSPTDDAVRLAPALRVRAVACLAPDPRRDGHRTAALLQRRGA